MNKKFKRLYRKLRGFSCEVNVKHFGAKGDGTTDDTKALQAAIDALPPEGGVLVIPLGVYLVSATLHVKDRRSTQMIGCGFGHLGLKSGTILKWEGKCGGTLLHLNGFSQSSVERLALDGNCKKAGCGIHIQHDQTATVVSQKNVFRQVLFGNLQVGLKIGETNENQGNNDQCDVHSCWFRQNDVGVLFQGDQSFQWQFHGCQFWEHTEAAIRTGYAEPNGGGFQMFGGALLYNDIDFDVPRITSGLLLSGIHSERARVFLKHDTPTGNPGRSVILQGVWQNSAKSDFTELKPGEEEYSIRFKTSNNLLVQGCRFVRGIEVDNLGGGSNQVVYRTFINTFTSSNIIKLGPTAPYRVLEIGRSEESFLEVDGGKNIRGTVVVSGEEITGTAMFPLEEPDVNYYVTLTPISTTGTPADGSNRIKSVSKLQTGLTVTVETAPGQGNSITFDWILIR